MIKRVVDKPKTQVVKKFPKFDLDKIYMFEATVGKTLYQLKKNYSIGSNEYGFYQLEHTGCTLCGTEDSFERLINYVNHKLNLALRGTVYILDNQEQLARFILGCREFPKFEETISESQLVEDEVSIDSINSAKKIYGFVGNNKPVIYKAQRVEDNEYAFVGIHGTDFYANGTFSTLKGLIKASTPVYQFDTQEEFLKWALEQTTGKKFRNVELKGMTLGGCMTVDYTNETTGIESFQ